MRIVMVVLVALVVAGCGSTYREKGNFVPHPADVSAGDGQVRALASVIGIRSADKKAGLPLSVETRVQVENRGETPITFDPTTLRLTSGDLRPFGQPIVMPPGSIEIPAGQSATVQANFPYPAGSSQRGVDLNGLNLEWVAERDGRRIAQSATFTRRSSDAERARSTRPNFGIGIGVGTIID